MADSMDVGKHSLITGTPKLSAQLGEKGGATQTNGIQLQQHLHDALEEGSEHTSEEAVHENPRVDLFQKNPSASHGMSLDYIPPIIRNKKTVAKLDKIAMNKEIEK